MMLTEVAHWNSTCSGASSTQRSRTLSKCRRTQRGSATRSAFGQRFQVHAALAAG
ncbi:MAG: hypothetical protein U1E52_09360 [Geminicoccaceae bacterium]